MTNSRGRILVAGIGNIFQGDDAFGVEVVNRISRRPLPDGVAVRDFGIRGFDLAYALNDEWDIVILVDAIARQGQEPPGTVCVVEPDRNDFERIFPEAGIQPHGMHPLEALRLASSMGELPRRLLVIGCEPAELGGDDGAMGLSAAVEAAVDVAVQTIERIISETLAPAAS